MEVWIRGAVANAESALARLTSAPLPPKGKLSFTTDLIGMASQADFIQENIPEQLELDQTVAETKARNASASAADIDAAIDEALAAVRAERFDPHGG